jgi:hypothetical protein
MLALTRCLAEETEEMKISVFGGRQASETPPKLDFIQLQQVKNP